MFGLFGDLFDFNHDGKLDGFERAAEFAAFASMFDESKRERSCRGDGFGDDGYDDNYNSDEDY